MCQLYLCSWNYAFSPFWRDSAFVFSFTKYSRLVLTSSAAHCLSSIKLLLVFVICVAVDRDVRSMSQQGNSVYFSRLYECLHRLFCSFSFYWKVKKKYVENKRKIPQIPVSTDLWSFLIWSIWWKQTKSKQIQCLHTLAVDILLVFFPKIFCEFRRILFNILNTFFDFDNNWI